MDVPAARTGIMQVRAGYHRGDRDLRPLRATEARFGLDPGRYPAAVPAPSSDEARRRQAVVDALIEIGIADGVFHLMAVDGQLLELRCETPRCYCDQGRTFFPKPPVPDSDWDPTLDHYPILRSNGGHKDPWNVRLAHKLCNREDFAWRDRVTRMIKEHRSLAEMADELNRVGVLHPYGSGPWTAESVRSAFVAS